MTPRLVIRMSAPDLWLCEDFVTLDECAELIEVSRPRLAPAGVGDSMRRNYLRIAEGIGIGHRCFDLADAIQQRMAQMLGAPVEHMENLNILRYAPGGYYVPHTDFFPAGRPVDPHVFGTGGQRIASVIIYLNDDFTGGFTRFTKANISIAPRRGSALFFDNRNARGELDESTEHEGMPVTSGEKWIATQWLRESVYIPAAHLKREEAA